jgi:hypothetical protein
MPSDFGIMYVVLAPCVWFETLTILLQYIHKPKLQAHACGRLKHYHPHACRVNTLRGIVTIPYCGRFHSHFFYPFWGPFEAEAETKKKLRAHKVFYTVAKRRFILQAT